MSWANTLKDLARQEFHRRDARVLIPVRWWKVAVVVTTVCAYTDPLEWYLAELAD